MRHVAGLLDHLGGLEEERWGQRQAHGLGGLQIDDQLGFQALAPEKVRLADNDGLMPRDESEGVFPEKVPFRERFL